MSAGYLVSGCPGQTALVTGRGPASAERAPASPALAPMSSCGADGGMEDVAGEVRSFGATGRGWSAARCPTSTRRRVPTRFSQVAVDILVNNAGMIARGPTAGIALDTWREVLTVNLDSVFLLAQRSASRCRPGERRDRQHRLAAVVPGRADVASYTASKHAVTGLTKSLANEWASLGVNVNAVAPGYVVTNNTEALRGDPDREPSIRSRIPAGHSGARGHRRRGRLPGVAAARYVHGHTLVVDGGWMGR